LWTRKTIKNVTIVVRSGRARQERFAFRGFFESIVPDERAITQLALRGVSNFAQSSPKFNRASEMPDAVHQMRLMSGQARTGTILVLDVCRWR
jgi:hypothetical protein